MNGRDPSAHTASVGHFPLTEESCRDARKAVDVDVRWILQHDMGNTASPSSLASPAPSFYSAFSSGPPFLIRS